MGMASLLLAWAVPECLAFLFRWDNAPIVVLRLEKKLLHAREGCEWKLVGGGQVVQVCAEPKKPAKLLKHLANIKVTCQFFPNLPSFKCPPAQLQTCMLFLVDPIPLVALPRAGISYKVLCCQAML